MRTDTYFYGVVSYVVAQRTSEIGIRMALGAPNAAVLRLVLGQGLKLAGLGLGYGVVSALLLAPFLSRLLFGLRPVDPFIFTVVPALLMGITLAAC